MICSTPLCENYTEGSTLYCGSCNTANRKSAKAAIKVKKKYFIPKQSEKMKGALKEYSVKRKEHLKKYPNCQAKLLECEKIAVDVHHVEGRTGDNLNKEESFMSVCRHCHTIIHDKLSAETRREKGLLK